MSITPRLDYFIPARVSPRITAQYSGLYFMPAFSLYGLVTDDERDDPAFLALLISELYEDKRMARYLSERRCQTVNDAIACNLMRRVPYKTLTKWASQLGRQVEIAGPVNTTPPGKPVLIGETVKECPDKALFLANAEDHSLADLVTHLSPDQAEFIRRTIIEMLAIGLK